MLLKYKQFILTIVPQTPTDAVRFIRMDGFDMDVPNSKLQYDFIHGFTYFLIHLINLQYLNKQYVFGNWGKIVRSRYIWDFFQELILINFSIVYTLTGKPNSLHDSADGEEDGRYQSNLEHSFYLRIAIYSHLIRTLHMQSITYW